MKNKNDKEMVKIPVSKQLTFKGKYVDYKLEALGDTKKKIKRLMSKVLCCQNTSLDVLTTLALISAASFCLIPAASTLSSSVEEFSSEHDINNGSITIYASLLTFFAGALQLIKWSANRSPNLSSDQDDLLKAIIKKHRLHITYDFYPNPNDVIKAIENMEKELQTARIGALSDLKPFKNFKAPYAIVFAFINENYVYSSDACCGGPEPSKAP